MKNPFAKSNPAPTGAGKPMHVKVKSILRVTNILTAIIFLAFGLALLIAPTISNKIIGFALAVLLTALGLYYLLSYFREDKLVAFTRQDMTTGMICLIGGILLFIMPELPASILPYIWGAALIVGGLAKIQTGLDMFRLGADNWWHTLIGAAIALGLGITALANPFDTSMTLLRFIGCGLVIEGLMDGYCWFIFDRLRKGLKLDD